LLRQAASAFRVVAGEPRIAAEHALEVELPFLQIVLPTFQVVPLVVGDAAPQDVAHVLHQLWGGRETLIVVSSDLSRVKRVSRLAQQRAIGRVLHQGMLEQVGRIRRHALLE
jgi:AmmeMemoRadiSam system protein B